MSTCMQQAWRREGHGNSGPAVMMRDTARFIMPARCLPAATVCTVNTTHVWSEVSQWLP